jgi:hypothetical protein
VQCPRTLAAIREPTKKEKRRERGKKNVALREPQKKKTYVGFEEEGFILGSRFIDS